MREHIKPYLLGATIGGSAQTLIESMKIILGENDIHLKFPNGFASLNPLEEFSEGSIPAVVGVAIGRYGYRFASRLAGVPPNPEYENLFMIMGGMVGYTGMATAGVFLHSYLGVHDVKWGPFR